VVLPFPRPPFFFSLTLGSPLSSPLKDLMYPYCEFTPALFSDDERSGHLFPPILAEDCDSPTLTPHAPPSLFLPKAAPSCVSPLRNPSGLFRWRTPRRMRESPTSFFFRYSTNVIFAPPDLCRFLYIVANSPFTCGTGAFALRSLPLPRDLEVFLSSSSRLLLLPPSHENSSKSRPTVTPPFLLSPPSSQMPQNCIVAAVEVTLPRPFLFAPLFFPHEVHRPSS